jgi:hypothetical protein
MEEDMQLWNVYDNISVSRQGILYRKVTSHMLSYYYHRAHVENSLIIALAILEFDREGQHL